MRCLVLVLLVAQAAALPLAGDEANAPIGMFSSDDDEATLTAELDKAIGRVQMGMSANDLGDSASVEGSAGATDWGKKAANEIENMSKSEMAEIGSVAGISGDDKLLSQFKKDVEDAKAHQGKPAKLKAKKSEIEMAADKALADPAEHKALREAGEKAELDYNTMIPSATSLLQEGPEDGADDLGESEFALMGGNDNDVAKAINEQINGQVSNQLGQIPTDTGSVDVLQKFEQDQQQASEFVMAQDKHQTPKNAKAQGADLGESDDQTKTAKQAKAEKAKKAMQEAEAAMKASAAAMANMHAELGEGADTN